MNLQCNLPSNFSLQELLKFISVEPQLANAIEQLEDDQMDLYSELEAKDKEIEFLKDRLRRINGIATELDTDIYVDDLEIDDLISLVHKAVDIIDDLTVEIG